MKNFNDKDLMKYISTKLNLTSPKEIGSGKRGTAFVVNEYSDRVYKITTDSGEVKDCRIILNSHKDFFVQIFNIYKLRVNKQFINKWLIVKEKITPLNNSEKREHALLRASIEAWPVPDNYLKAMCLADNLDYDYGKKLNKLYEQISDTFIMRMDMYDLNSGNVGWRNNNKSVLVCFDLGNYHDQDDESDELDLNETKNNQNDIINIIQYKVSYHTNDDIDIIYKGIDRERAEQNYNDFDDIPIDRLNNKDNSVILEKKEYTFKFIYKLDDYETIDDFPIEDYYKDKSIYTLVSETDWEEVNSKTIEPVNKNSDKLLYDVGTWFKQKYGNREYNKIRVYDDMENYLGCIMLRLKDHTENIYNNDRFENCDYYISVVIADYDVTKKRFEQINQMERKNNEFHLKFSSNTPSTIIIKNIEQLIDECKEKIVQNI